jgi:hypothetical protein
VQAILLWGFAAKTHFLGADAELTDTDGTLNAAGKRISHLLREEWTTRGSGTTGTDGRLAFRGFFGSYAVSVSGAGGHETVQEVRLTKSAPRETVKLAE